MLVFGVIGYLMKKLSLEAAPMVLAFVLGPLMETALRQSLIKVQGQLFHLLHPTHFRGLPHHRHRFDDHAPSPLVPWTPAGGEDRIGRCNLSFPHPKGARGSPARDPAKKLKEETCHL